MKVRHKNKINVHLSHSLLIWIDVMLIFFYLFFISIVCQPENNVINDLYKTIVHKKNVSRKKSIRRVTNVCYVNRYYHTQYNSKRP